MNSSDRGMQDLLGKPGKGKDGLPEEEHPSLVEEARQRRKATSPQRKRDTVKDALDQIEELTTKITGLEGLQKLHATDIDAALQGLEQRLNTLASTPLATANPRLPAPHELEEMIMNKEFHQFKDVQTWFNQLSKYSKHATMKSVLNLIILWHQKVFPTLENP